MKEYETRRKPYWARSHFVPFASQNLAEVAEKLIRKVRQGLTTDPKYFNYKRSSMLCRQLRAWEKVMREHALLA